MRLVIASVSIFALLACAPTTLETPQNHPANPRVHPATPSKPPPSLAPNFDPFAAYPEEAGSQTSSGHDSKPHR